MIKEIELEDNGRIDMVLAFKDYLKKHPLSFLALTNSRNSQVATSLQRSELIELTGCINLILSNYSESYFTSSLFEKAINKLKEDKIITPDFRMIRYKSGMALAYSDIDSTGLLFVADSEEHATALSFWGELQAIDDYTNEAEFEFLEIRGLELDKHPYCNINYINGELYFGN